MHTGPAASPWISVTDRLPEPGRLVLVAGAEAPPTLAYLESDGGKFYDPRYGWVIALHWSEVTMPDGSPLPNQENCD